MYGFTPSKDSPLESSWYSALYNIRNLGNIQSKPDSQNTQQLLSLQLTSSVMLFTFKGI